MLPDRHPPRGRLKLLACWITEDRSSGVFCVQLGERGKTCIDAGNKVLNKKSWSHFHSIVAGSVKSSEKDSKTIASPSCITGSSARNKMSEPEVIDLVSDDEDSVMIVDDDDDDASQVSFFLNMIFFHSLVCSSDYNLFKNFLG
jgi:hypothetical protein